MSNLPLTGPPGVGKTTVIRRAIDAAAGVTFRGFVTSEIRRVGRRLGFELHTLDGRVRRLAHVDLRSEHRVGRYGVDVAAVEAIVETTLAVGPPVDVVVIDEVGKMECYSPRFCRMVERLLSSPQPVLATVAQRGEGFIAEVRGRGDIETWEVTYGNRNAMPERVAAWSQGVIEPEPQPTPP